MYYVWAVLFLAANVLAWLSSLFMVPGNWIIVGLAALFAWQFPAEPGAAAGSGLGWRTVLILGLLAAAGEVIEFAAGAAGAAKQGGSRRGMVLAIAGAFLGSLAGAAIGIPIPVIGPLIGAVGGGALGAFAGAYAGEAWKGRTSAESYQISRGALVGRVLGTVGKLGVGAIMVVVTAIAAFF
jgi:uncharacterized protein YqgC (DUF456 family)